MLLNRSFSVCFRFVALAQSLFLVVRNFVLDFLIMDEVGRRAKKKMPVIFNCFKTVVFLLFFPLASPLNDEGFLSLFIITLVSSHPLFFFYLTWLCVRLGLLWHSIFGYFKLLIFACLKTLNKP